MKYFKRTAKKAVVTLSRCLLLPDNHFLVHRLPEFGNLMESVLENTLLNLMNEALAGDYNITARRRYIALPHPQSNNTSTPKKNGSK